MGGSALPIYDEGGGCEKFRISKDSSMKFHSILSYALAKSSFTTRKRFLPVMWFIECTASCKIIALSVVERPEIKLDWLGEIIRQERFNTIC